MENEMYWFGFSQTLLKPPGRAVACGPYTSWEEAKLYREKAKAWDCNVSIPFMAQNKEEADVKAEIET